jgi:hypothetical protein
VARVEGLVALGPGVTLLAYALRASGAVEVRCPSCGVTRIVARPGETELLRHDAGCLVQRKIDWAYGRPGAH